MKKSHLLGVVFTMLAVPAEIWASQVTFNINDSFTGGDWFTLNGALGPLETSANSLDILSFTWTFETTTSDSDPNTDWGFYSDAIVDCNLSIGAYSFACGGGPNHIELGFEFYYFETDGSEWGVERYIADAALADAFGFSNISFQFETFWTSVPKGSILPNGDALISQPWSSIGCDTYNSIQYSYQGQMYTGASVCTGGIIWTVIPIPPALWLFGSGLLGLIGIARRKH